MTDPRTLPAPFDRVVAALELAAAAAGGSVAYATNVRARKTGDLLDLDAALYLSADSTDLFPILFVPGDEPVGVDAVDTVAAHQRATGARGSAVVSTAGFARPARKRADDEGVALITASVEGTDGWPSWLANAGFESQNFQWRVRNIALPPAPGLPKNIFDEKHGPRDEVFANPQGRRFTAEELVRRWMKQPANARAIREGLPRDGRPVTREVTMRFDRPMRILANTVRPVPPVLWSKFGVEAWVEVRRVPLKLVEAPQRDLPGSPLCAYASAPIPGPTGDGRLWLWLEAVEGEGDPRLRMEMLADEAPATPPADS